ncbi:outer membrane beta-barrel protein [Vibrio sp. F74]|uniref:outer membrane beta-barrel protein n=1 Tax=Vibrio sp. F74 TaxID=700020 RepID=UPI0035F54FBE
MKQTKIALFLVAAVSVSTLQFARANENVEQYSEDYFYVAPKALFLSDLDDEKETFAYGIDAGYQWNPYLRTELGVANLRSVLSNSNDDLIGYSASIVGVLPLSKYANINLGVGPMAYWSDDKNDTVAMAKLNIEYGITEALDLVLGYRYFHKLTDNSLYAYELGLKYNFGQSETYIAEPVVEVEPEPVVVVEPLPEPTPLIDPIQVLVDCEYDVVVEEYTVRKNDYLTKIAKMYDMQYKKLKELNPKYFGDRDPDLIFPGEIVELDVLQKRVTKRESCDGEYIYLKERH